MIDAQLTVDEEGNTYRARARGTDAPISIREYLPEHWALRDSVTLLVRARDSSTEDSYEQGLVQFLRAARAWAQLHNPHLVRVTQYMEDAGTGYIVMEDRPGQALDRLLPKWGGMLPPTEVMPLLEGLLDGLATVHAAQLVHGNIHPGSVLIGDDGVPQLIEFSTALRDPTAADATPVARLSPGYVPIEQYSVHSCLSTRTDIYALGATLYRCVTGLRPSDARERVAALSSDLDDPLLPAVQIADPKYDPTLLGLIDQMLQPFDDARPDSVQSILQSLHTATDVADSVPVLKLPTGAASEPNALAVPVAAHRSIAPARAAAGRCTICAAELPLGPRPVFRAGRLARVMIIGQAPGTAVHRSGVPWDDPSGRRLRAWMEVSDETFYDADRIAIVPMGFCYPGRYERGGDLPPRPECAPLWHPALLDQMTNIKLTLLVGQYAQKYYLGKRAKRTLTETVAAFEDYLPEFLPTPHPSWRTNAWQKNNPWFDERVLPALRRLIAKLLA